MFSQFFVQIFALYKFFRKNLRKKRRKFSMDPIWKILCMKSHCVHNIFWTRYRTTFFINDDNDDDDEEEEEEEERGEGEYRPLMNSRSITINVPAVSILRRSIHFKRASAS